jgi:hypothetical protein
MNTIVTQSFLPNQLWIVYSGFFSLINLYEQQNNEIEKIFKLFDRFSQSQTAQADTSIAPFLERLKTKAAIDSLKERNKRILEVVQKANSKISNSFLMKEELESCKNLTQLIVQNILRNISYCDNEFKEYNSFLASYTSKFLNNIELKMEMSDAKISYDDFNILASSNLAIIRNNYLGFYFGILKWINNFAPINP